MAAVVLLIFSTPLTMTPGGKPVTDDPGVRSKSPLTTVKPEFVTVESARIEEE